MNPVWKSITGVLYGTGIGMTGGYLWLNVSPMLAIGVALIGMSLGLLIEPKEEK